VSDSDPAESLAELQRERDTARSRLRGNVEAIRAQLAERSIPARIGDRATEAALETLETAKDVARDNKVVVGVTIAALLGWTLREPITRLVKSQLPRKSARWWPFP
jgi:hypothetical protein